MASRGNRNPYSLLATRYSLTMVQFAKSGWRDGWYIVPWDVTFRDLDGLGHVNNSVFFTYFEWARTRYWFDLMGGGTRGEDIGFIVAHAACDFRLQLQMEPIEIRTRIGEMRNTSFDFVSEIWKSNGAELAATGKTVVVLFDWDINMKVPITSELREKVRRFQCSPDAS